MRQFSVRGLGHHVRRSRGREVVERGQRQIRRFCDSFSKKNENFSFAGGYAGTGSSDTKNQFSGSGPSLSYFSHEMSLAVVSRFLSAIEFAPREATVRPEVQSPETARTRA